jgi:aryl-alcohol dehydrogenase-like predicted oxidoreductase
MRYRPFGRTGWQVSEIGIGCSGIGGGLHHGDRREALRMLRQALDAGVNFYDTSDTYSQGGSERVLGEALRGRRTDVIVATKVGFVYTPLGRLALSLRPLFRPFQHMLRPVRRQLNTARYSQKSLNYSPAYVMAAAERSLRRLGTDYLDLYQLHNPPPETIRQGDCFAPLERLKQQGKIREYAVSCAGAADALLCVAHPGVASVQVPASLLDQDTGIDVLPRVAQQARVGVIVRVPLAQGLLSGRHGDTKAEQVVKNSEVLSARTRRAAGFRFLERDGRTMAQAALQYVLQLPSVSTVIPGMSRCATLDENLRALDAPPLTPDELARIRTLHGKEAAELMHGAE